MMDDDEEYTDAMNEINDIEDQDDDNLTEDLSSEELSPELVKTARAEAMEVVIPHGVYVKVPIEECVCVRKTRKRPIGVRGVDVNKRDSMSLEYRARLVAKEIKRDNNNDDSATTPPLAKKALFTLAVSDLARNRGNVVGGEQKLLFIDVRRAYVYVLAQRLVYVALPDEHATPGMCGRLVKAMYGTRDAAVKLEDRYRGH